MGTYPCDVRAAWQLQSVRAAACDPGGIGTCRLTPGTSPLQHSQACTGDHACYSFSFSKLLFFYLLHGGWLCCVTNQPTFYVAVCPICQVALQDCDLPLQVLAMLPVAGQAARGAEWEQGFRGACRGGSNAEHTASGQCSCLVGLGSCCWKLHL